MRPALSSQLSNENFEARIRATGMAHHNPAGTAVMGKVVDPNLHFYGVQNLRPLCCLGVTHRRLCMLFYQTHPTNGDRHINGLSYLVLFVRRAIYRSRR